MWRGSIVAGVAIAVLAVPVVVVAGGGSFFDQGVPSSAQETVWGTTDDVSTDANDWEPVPSMAQGVEATLDIVPPAPLYLSVDLKAGKAQFRLVDAGGDVVNPSSVLFSGKGVSTATFMTTGEGLEDPTIEWKRKGSDPVEAKSVVVSTSGEQD
jgi:hypothetical protein